MPALWLPLVWSLHAPLADARRQRRRSIESLREACRADDIAACTALGTRVLDGDGVDSDTAWAANLYRDACAWGAPEACWRLGRLYTTHPQMGTAEQIPPLYRAACEGGWAEACVDLDALEEGGTADGTALLRTACDSGVARGCYALGRRLEAQVWDADALTAAAASFQRACDLGSGEGCRGLAAATRAGRGVPASAEAAAALTERACELGDAAACPKPPAAEPGVLDDPAACQQGDAARCLNLAAAATDPAEVASWLEIACAGRASAGCLQLAGHLWDGRGTAQDRGRSLGLLRAACEAGTEGACPTLENIVRSLGASLSEDCLEGRASAQLCAQLGELLGSGAGGTELLQKTCAGVDRLGCETLALGYASAVGVSGACSPYAPEDCLQEGLRTLGTPSTTSTERRAAAALLLQSCEADVFESCTVLGLLLRGGELLPPEPDRSLNLLRRGCQGWEPTACAVLP